MNFTNLVATYIWEPSIKRANTSGYI
ncbi:hypothetical protein THF5G08_140081 [Vibrio jasicida]|nr:hypothetical protein THF5G08_140081 [Vibrio jasicida]